MPTKRYRLPERLVTLFFADGELEGLELEVSVRASIRHVFDVFEALADLTTTRDSMEGLYRTWAERYLRSWNLEDDDGPVACTADAFVECIDVTSAGVILGKWIREVSKVPDPLPPPSPDGDTFETPTPSISPSP